jgi:hypothetical protein
MACPGGPGNLSSVVRPRRPSFPGSAAGARVGSQRRSLHGARRDDSRQSRRQRHHVTDVPARPTRSQASSGPDCEPGGTGAPGALWPAYGLLNRTLFYTVNEAGVLIEARRLYYNAARLLSSLS